ncbi:Hypothetical protein R9X50_00647400 [Acrodontium crateriforme]|uniref:non-specific serine/threonine protein kinase n=1 Tax=Acrodontium crateriforme TaxID=150365 RepID=A0AAQ3M9W5_9PEZI|nr:Hypothetical protein R9X50_00647400 [Acrodontium crateriforme]
MILDQLLSRLKAIHSNGLVHRDMKPSNCLTGVGKYGNIIYISDFSLAREPRDNVPDLPPESRARLMGTARFASTRGHFGQEQSAWDDLESLGYMMIYFLAGRLPWQGIDADDVNEHDRLVFLRKQSMTPAKMCSGFPKDVRNS